jgi:hypothetical protein
VSARFDAATLVNKNSGARDGSVSHLRTSAVGASPGGGERPPMPQAPDSTAGMPPLPELNFDYAIKEYHDLHRPRSKGDTT